MIHILLLVLFFTLFCPNFFSTYLHVAVSQYNFASLVVILCSLKDLSAVDLSLASKALCILFLLMSSHVVVSQTNFASLTGIYFKDLAAMNFQFLVYLDRLSPVHLLILAAQEHL